MPVSIDTVTLMSLTISQLQGLLKSILTEDRAMPEGHSKQNAFTLIAQIPRIIAYKQRTLIKNLF